MEVNSNSQKLRKLNEVNVLIHHSLKNKRILKGTIQQVADTHISIIMKRGEETQNHIPIKIPIEESNLYVPATALKKVGRLVFLQRYVGKTISFVITKIENEPHGRVAIASMKEAVNKYFDNVLKAGFDNLNDVAVVNVLATGNRFIVIEFNGYVSTVSDREISYSEIPDITQYFREHKYREFEIVRMDPTLKYMEFSRRDLLGDVFKDKVYKQNKYKKSDVVLGKAVGVTKDNRLTIEIEPEIIALAEYPKNVTVKKGSNVSGIISGINKNKRKIYLGNLSVL